MALTQIKDLPVATAAVLRRRAEAAGVTMPEQVRHELLALAGQRVPIDAVVEFLRAERPDQMVLEIDTVAMALIDTYNLPARVWQVLASRAAAAGMPLGEYVCKELIMVAQRTADDAMLEFRAALDQQDPGFATDMAAIAASIQYARGA